MKFHPLCTDIQLPEKFTYPFCYTPHPLCVLAAEQLKRHIGEDENLRKVAEQGKMFGVLIVKNNAGSVGFLAAYSGTTCFDFDNSYFVPPVYDYLDEEGFFKKGEREITQINKTICEVETIIEKEHLKEENEKIRACAEKEIQDYRNVITKAKEERDKKRLSGCTPCEEKQMQAESSFMKAELKRLKERKRREVEEKTRRYAELMLLAETLKSERKTKSDVLQEKLFRHFEMLDKDGNRKDICDIFKEYNAGIPPAGTGECCAPKMIQFAYANNYTLVAMAEFWYGATPAAEIRHHMQYYPSCTSKCRPLLTYMLRGIKTDENPMNLNESSSLEVVYEDDYLIVVNKPAGMLTVDGKINNVSAESVLRERYPGEDVRAVHRLDMDTSGLVVFARNGSVLADMQKQFAGRKVKKNYTAVLDGEIKRENGRISLPLSPDYINRPMQTVDKENGKMSVTSYRVISVKQGYTRISLVPITGRTHQLRVHCAHSEGLNCPIVGDRLYGKPAERLMLHARYLEFTHPVTNKTVVVRKEPDF